MASPSIQFAVSRLTFTETTLRHAWDNCWNDQTTPPSAFQRIWFLYRRLLAFFFQSWPTTAAKWSLESTFGNVAMRRSRFQHNLLFSSRHLSSAAEKVGSPPSWIRSRFEPWTTAGAATYHTSNGLSHFVSWYSVGASAKRRHGKYWQALEIYKAASHRILKG